MLDLRDLTFEHLIIYVAVVETGSLTRAADRLGFEKTAVSKAIQRLEFVLQSTLIVRSTRRINVTEAGLSFFDACRNIAYLADEAVIAAHPSTAELRGTLPIAASVEYSAIVLAPALARLCEAHPYLSIETVSSDRLIHLISEGVDIDVRMGELIDSNNRAVRIGGCWKWLVASPSFVSSKKIPGNIRDVCTASFH